MTLLTLAMSVALRGAPANNVQGAADAPRLLSNPCVHGDTVVFTYASDLWSAKVSGGPATRLTSGYGNKAYPFISPDGTMIAFTAAYDGAPDVYVIPTAGGIPKRLTYDAVPDTDLGWTPDGKVMYRTAGASSHLQRQQALFYVDPKGGLPESTPIREIYYGTVYNGGQNLVYTRMPSFLFNWRRYRGGTQGVVSFYNFATNSYSELPHGREQTYFPMPIGSDIYYVSDKGDGVLNLYRYSMKSKSAVKITNFTDEDIKYASSDGKSIVFNQDGYLWYYDPGSEASPHKLSPTFNADLLLTRPELKHLGGSIAGISISPSGARIAAEARGELFSVPTESGDTRDITNTQGTREQNPQWSTDGQTIFFLSDADGSEQLYSTPQLGGKQTKLTSMTQDVLQFVVSPDDKKALITVANGDAYWIDLASQKATLVAAPPYGVANTDWSPDSKWIALTIPKATGSARVVLYNLADGKTTEVTDGFYPDSDVKFDLNGKYLYIVSSRTFVPTPDLFGPSLKVDNTMRIYALMLAKDTPSPLAPKDDEEPAKGAEPVKEGPHGPMRPGGPRPPMPGMPGAAGGPPPPADIKIDFDGLASRIVPLPLPPGAYGLFTGLDGGILYAAPGGLFRFDWATKHAEPVIVGPVQDVSITPDRTQIAYKFGDILGKVRLGGPPSQLGAGKIDTSGVEAVIDPKAEWKEIFWEAWRFDHDNFYDENFGGQDWKKIGDHYASMLDDVRTRTDLNTVLALLISELGTSHCYVEAPGDLGPSPRPTPVGYLGADYKVVDGHVQIAKVYKGESDDETNTGPLGVPGINVTAGEYLLDIDGQPVTPNTPPAELLVDKVGKQVVLTVNSKPTEEGAEKVRVIPISNEIQIRYIDFLEKSKAYVDKVSGGRIGYMHIRDTAAPGSQDFVRGFFTQTDKDAMIVDERWNGGGYPQPWFVETLAHKLLNYGQARNAKKDAPLAPIFNGPAAMLINGYAGSGGDLFPWTFKAYGIGPLIGKRTWGGLVGIGQGADLVDGGSISSPSFSIYKYGGDEIIAENHGIDPDIDVDNRPDLVAEGQDPQLEAAVKYLMDQLAKLPPKPVRTKMTHVSPEGRLDLPGGQQSKP